MHAMLSAAIKEQWCFHDLITFRKKLARISNARNQSTINPRRRSYVAHLLPVLHLVLSSLIFSASFLSRTYLSVSRRLRKIVANQLANQIIHFCRKFHVSVPHCATSPSGAFSGTAVRFRPRRKRNRKSQPL